jgi:hypothetical protein
MPLYHRPIWELNYRSMSPAQLVAELERLVRVRHFYSDIVQRKALIADELAIRAHLSPRPIILMMD